MNRQTTDMIPPPGYRFLPNGNSALTERAKKLTANHGKPLWSVLQDTRVGESQIHVGYHIPIEVYRHFERRKFSLFEPLIQEAYPGLVDPDDLLKLYEDKFACLELSDVARLTKVQMKWLVEDHDWVLRNCTMYFSHLNHCRDHLFDHLEDGDICENCMHDRLMHFQETMYPVFLDIANNIILEWQSSEDSEDHDEHEECNGK